MLLHTRASAQPSAADRLAADLVRRYYADVDYQPPKSFDAVRWSAWLAPDYIYVNPSGKPLIGKDAAVAHVASEFRAFSEVRSSPTVINVKQYGPDLLATVLAMSITAATSGAARIGVETTVLLNFRRSGTRWQVVDEAVVPKTER